MPLVLAGICLLSGCSERAVQFETDRGHLRRQKLATELEDFQTEPVETRLRDVRRVMARYFGTPDEPRLPDLDGVELQGVLDLELLQLAAGAGKDSTVDRPTGLFRRLCVQCHGISGDGHGPLARQLNPYPRDYRRGIFKFKRTPTTLPPTAADLHNVLVRGVPGTAMPSFQLLNELQREALVQYVRYLAVRGAFERAIIEEAAFELDEDELLLDPELREGGHTQRQQLGILDDIAASVIRPWLEADEHVTEVPSRPEDYGSELSIARGRELFFTTLTNCATCHGATALGDGTMDDYDEWTKELEPTSPDALRVHLALGALLPRKTQPRNLREGLYRGGHEPADLFVKVKNGIAGTTMPNVAIQLSDQDIWHLVAYARNLPFDPVNRPADLLALDQDGNTP